METIYVSVEKITAQDSQNNQSTKVFLIENKNFKYEGNEISFQEIAQLIKGNIDCFVIGDTIVWCDKEAVAKKLPVNKAATEYAYSLAGLEVTYDGNIPNWYLYGNVVFVEKKNYLF